MTEEGDHLDAPAAGVNDYGYVPSKLPSMTATARRQRAKDAIVVEIVRPSFRAGNVLEIGAGIGQLSELLAANGVDVTGSDIQPFLVEHMASRGMRAIVAGELNLAPMLDRRYDNVLGGGPSTLITPTSMSSVGRTSPCTRRSSPAPDSSSSCRVCGASRGARDRTT